MTLMAMDHTLSPAAARIEKAMPSIQLTDGWGLYHRSDIGTVELLAKRADLAKRVRRIYAYKEEHRILGKRVDWTPTSGRTDASRLLLQEIQPTKGPS